MYSGSRRLQVRAQLARVGPRRSAARRTPPAACRPARPRAPRPRASRTAGCPRSARLDLAQLDAEAAHLHLVVERGPGTPARRPAATAPGRRCGTAARPAPPRTGRGRSAPPSAPAGPGSRAPGRRRRCTARPARRPAPARPRRPARRPACWRSAGRWAARVPRPRGASATATRWRPPWSPVGPYRLTSVDAEAPRRSRASSRGSASPPTSDAAQRRAARPSHRASSARRAASARRVVVISRGRQPLAPAPRRSACASPSAGTSRRAPPAAARHRLPDRGVEATTRDCSSDARRPASTPKRRCVPAHAGSTARRCATMHALGPPGGAGGVDDVRQVLGRQPALAARDGSRARSRSASRVEADRTTRRRAAAACRSRRCLRQQHRRGARPRSMKASRSARVRRVERHVGAARLEHGQQRRPPSPASAPRRCRTRTSGPTPSAAQVVREPVGPRVRAPRRSAARPRRRTATASGRARRLRLEQLVDARVRAGTSSPCRFHSTQQLPRARPRPSSGSVARAAASGVGGDRLRAAAAKCPSIRSTVAASNRSVL